MNTIDEHKKETVLTEYFNMYKMAYRIRTAVAYAWD